MTSTDEFEPYVLCRIAGSQFECALWTMPNEKRALALFRTSELAIRYRDGLHLGTDWKVVRPAKADLVQILKTGYSAGVEHAVLDPDLQSAQFVFVLKHVLQELGALQA